MNWDARVGSIVGVVDSAGHPFVQGPLATAYSGNRPNVGRTLATNRSRVASFRVESWRNVGIETLGGRPICGNRAMTPTSHRGFDNPFARDSDLRSHPGNVLRSSG